MKKTATLSECGKYRYTLGRSGLNLMSFVKPCLFIMLNPSTADDKIDDPTIKKCLHYATRENCTSLTVVNLFAYRATDPKELLKVPHSHRENQKFLSEEILRHRPGLVVVAWGSHSAVKYASLGWLNLQLFRANILPKCLGVNKDGNPKHPLYIKKDQPLTDYVAR